MEILPNADKAIIPIEKFTNYALDVAKEPDKATAFRLALGYTHENADMLIQNIQVNLCRFPAIRNGHNGHGWLYECIMSLVGVNGRSAKVLTAWIVRDNEDFPRLTSVYVTNRELR